MRHRIPCADLDEIRLLARDYPALTRRGYIGTLTVENMRRTLRKLTVALKDNPHFDPLLKSLRQDLHDLETQGSEEVLEVQNEIRSLVNDLVAAYDTNLHELSTTLPDGIRQSRFVAGMLDMSSWPAKQKFDKMFEWWLGRITAISKTLSVKRHAAAMKQNALVLAADSRVCPGKDRDKADGDEEYMIDYVIRARRANPHPISHKKVFDIAEKEFKHQHPNVGFLAKSYVLNNWRKFIGF